MKLDPTQANTLCVAVFVSQTTGKLHRRDLLAYYGISRSTLRRYYYPHSRELSRAVSLRYFHSGKKPSKLVFRCEDCTKIIPGGLWCTNCFDTREGYIVEYNHDAVELFVHYLFHGEHEEDGLLSR